MDILRKKIARRAIISQQIPQDASAQLRAGGSILRGQIWSPFFHENRALKPCVYLMADKFFLLTC